MSDAEVRDDQAGSRFILQQEGQVSELVYRIEPERLVLVHTGVPEKLEGRGIGGRLVQAALERALAEGRTVVPSCPFARRWIASHPDAAHDIVVV